MAIYIQNKDVIYRQEGDEAILFNPDNLNILVLNPTGCFIWDILKDSRSRKEIVTKILNKFEVPKETAEKDLDIFLSDLERKNFIEAA